MRPASAVEESRTASQTIAPRGATSQGSRSATAVGAFGAWSAPTVGRFGDSLARHSLWTIETTPGSAFESRDGGYRTVLRDSTSMATLVNWASDSPAAKLFERLPSLGGSSSLGGPSSPLGKAAGVVRPPFNVPMWTRTCVRVWSPVYGLLVFELPPDPPPEDNEAPLGAHADTHGGDVVGGLLSGAEDGPAAAPLLVGDLKRMVYERVLLSPAYRISLSLHGVLLNDEQQLPRPSTSDAKFELTLSRMPPALLATRGLSRLRIKNAALRTRTIEVGEETTAVELKEAICAVMTMGEYKWFSREGLLTRRSGCTLLASESAKADEKKGTSTVRVGDELLAESLKTVEASKGAVTCYRLTNGKPMAVETTGVVPLVLAPDQIWVSWCGLTLSDSAILYDMGCRTDDTIELEFASPCMPKQLQVLRVPAPEKKKGKGGKKGGGKKKK